MQWIVDSKMEEVTPKGVGELNVKENKEIICLHEKISLFNSSPTFSIYSIF